MTQQPETRKTSPHRKGKLTRRQALGTMLSVAATPIFLGGLIGYKYGEHSEQRSNRSDVQRAAGYLRCLPLVERLDSQKVTTIKASLLSSPEQKDCGFSDALSVGADDYKTAIAAAGDYKPLDSKITGQFDPVLQLPSPSRIQAEITHLDRVDTTSGIGASLIDGTLGAGVGGVVDVSLAAATMWAVYLTNKPKRN